MAINIIRDPFARGTGGVAGEQLGQLLSGGLQQLAAQKLQQMQSRHGLQALGIPQEEAKSLSLLPPALQQTIVRSLAEEGGLQNILGGLQSPSLQGTASLSQLPQEGEVAPTMQQIRALPTPTQKTRDVLAQTNRMKMQQPWEILQVKPVGKVQRELYKEARKEQNRIEKNLQPAIEKLNKAASAAKKDDLAIKNLKRIVKSGKLTSASWARFRKSIDESARAIAGGLGTAIGAGLGSVLPGAGTLAGATVGGGLGTAAGGFIPKFAGSPLDQAFKKSVYGFFKNIKDWFGGNIPVGEAQIFLETLPTLEMDDEAKLAVLDQMDALGQLVEAQANAKNEIIKAHGGYAPPNLFELMDNRLKPEMEKARNSFKSTIDKLLANA